MRLSHELHDNCAISLAVMRDVLRRFCGWPHEVEAMTTRLTMIDRANKYAEMTMRYYEQHDPKAKAAKVAFKEYKQGYIAGWRAAKKQRATQTVDDVICSHCGLGEQFDGTWHKPDCPTLNRPIQKPNPPMTGDGDGVGHAPKNSR